MSAEIVPVSSARALASMDDAKAAITRARELQDMESLTEWRSLAAAYEHYARERNLGTEAEKNGGEIRLRAERAMGAVDAELRPLGGDKKSAAARERQSESPREILISAPSGNTRANWRKLGAVDDETFEEIVKDVRESEPRVTTAAAVRRVPKNTKPAVRQAGITPAKHARDQARYVANIVRLAEQMTTALPYADFEVISTIPVEDGWLKQLGEARTMMTRFIRALSRDE